ncbi:MAG: Rrf2 family transcriptional regulator [Firmicutes bacterium]|nr:Rrf2 family transcriptional regulator [Bacillota bacterium]
MLLTKECDYGLRIMRTLADMKMKKVEDVCKIEHIPHKYAYKILKKMQDAKLVKSKRGPDGGYYIAKPLGTFTMYDVVSSIDDRLFVFECLREDVECQHNSENLPCMVHHELVRIQNMLMNEMKLKTMEQVLRN